jgi:hypothetical protein
MGTQRLYDFVDDNPLIEFHPCDYTNDPYRIAQNDNMISINAAIQIDLTGQVCADSIGEYFYAGIGGQVDFVRGAARSKGGKPIIVLPSTAKKGTVSRIVAFLDQGAGVVTSRGGTFASGRSRSSASRIPISGTISSTTRNSATSSTSIRCRWRWRAAFIRSSTSTRRRSATEKSSSGRSNRPTRRWSARSSTR